MSLVRVQVLIEEEENEALSREARRLRVSKSEVVRRSLRPLVKPPEEDPILQLIGFLPPGGPLDVGRNHDHYLYDQP